MTGAPFLQAADIDPDVRVGALAAELVYRCDSTFRTALEREVWVSLHTTAIRLRAAVWSPRCVACAWYAYQSRAPRGADRDALAGSPLGARASRTASDNPPATAGIAPSNDSTP